MSTNSNDPFDEFEFKPLTEGLGFHKKKETTFNSNFNKSQNSIDKKIEFKSSHLNFENENSKSKDKFSNNSKSTSREQDFSLKSPLPRQEFTQESKTNTIKNSSIKNIDIKSEFLTPMENLTSTISPSVYSTPQRVPAIEIPTIEDDSIAKAQTAVNEILKNLNHKKQQEDALNRNKRRVIWADANPSLSAGILDGMLVTALFLLSLILMLTITKVDLLANLNQPDPEYTIYIASALLFAGLQFVYMVTCRAFLGSTPGEWAFDQRCGNELQLASASYIPKVILRNLIILATGIVLTPIISMLTGFDLLAKLTGLQIQKQKI